MPPVVAELVEDARAGRALRRKGVGEPPTVVSTAAVAPRCRDATGRELDARARRGPTTSSGSCRGLTLARGRARGGARRRARRPRRPRRPRAVGLHARVARRRRGGRATASSQGSASTTGRETLDAAGRWVVPASSTRTCTSSRRSCSVDEFARLVLPLGTTAVVADPHEIANVLGIDGVHWLARPLRRLPLDIYFMAPSCVPASALRVAATAAHARRPRRPPAAPARARARRDDELPRRDRTALPASS